MTTASVARWSATALTAGLCLSLAAPAAAAPGGPRGAAPTTIALLGDTPYGDAQRLEFPALVDDIDADPRVRLVLHAGDVKSGSTTCDDARFADLAALYGTFDDPFVLTPGDNEWTDCHRPAAGGYVPTERLEAVRDVFYPEPGRTLGTQAMPVTAQSQAQPGHAAYVENVLFERSRVVFATVHVVGSENGLAPWTGIGDRPAERVAEFEARRAANLAWIAAAFDEAERTDAAGVVLLLQAEPVASPGFQAERDLIVREAAAFGRPVLLAHGDEHRYEEERRYAGVPNLTRLETFGDTATEWLRLTVDPRTPEVFSWEPQTVATT
ncbi:metallophosphoesterase [Trujillonella endophytica]|uniref:Calcineurin-like phosphoesterase n=1 Tax=Trujillonella endophytica TaxID=673521 RepID=A0A1H8SDY5_9ACTN|nr:metallophosphoesterase [Trujillella endophytica]SEO76765.1 Calcineurin-like phosphoesterase [Trujillella endophytica]